MEQYEPEAIDLEKRKIGDEAAWQREYLLRIISDTERVVHPEWLQFYDVLPDKEELRYTAMGVDLAISLNDTADYTAIVGANIYGYGKKVRIYILPNPLNERLTFPQTVERIKMVSSAISGESRVHIYIEKVGYQDSLVQQLNYEGYTAKGIEVHGQDKRARLALITAMIQNGQILFPQKGAEILIQQLIGFGVEKNDDLADAFSLLILKVIQDNPAGSGLYFGFLNSKTTPHDQRYCDCCWRSL